MPKIEAHVDIAAPCGQVFRYVMAPENATRYDPAVLRYEPLEDRPLHLGSRVRIVARFAFGIPSTVISQITEWHVSGESRQVVFTTITGPVRARGAHTFEPISTGTRYSWAMEWDEAPGLRGAALDRMMRLVWSNKLQQPLDNLKRLLEAPTPSEITP